MYAEERSDNNLAHLGNAKRNSLASRKKRLLVESSECEAGKG